jgi:hypothetical protein
MVGILSLMGGWGFYAHKEINKIAIFSLPPEMIGFYKKHIHTITESAVNADRRRFAVVDEAPRHYIDIDHFGDSAVYTMPRDWKHAVEIYGEDTLKAYVILPWHLQVMFYRLRDAFMLGDPEKILSISADLGHYIGDAHVPLHTTENYNGQLTGQEGIHAFWESRLPELYSNQYNFFVGKAEYISDVKNTVWKIIECSHASLDSVLRIEKLLTATFGEKKFSFETKGRQTMRVYSQEFSKAYHQALSGMVERQMRAAIKMTSNFWYTAWVDAGQPDLKKLINYSPTSDDLKKREEELKAWKEEQKIEAVRAHEEK